MPVEGNRLTLPFLPCPCRWLPSNRPSCPRRSTLRLPVEGNRLTLPFLPCRWLPSNGPSCPRRSTLRPRSFLARPLGLLARGLEHMDSDVSTTLWPDSTMLSMARSSASTSGPALLMTPSRRHRTSSGSSTRPPRPTLTSTPPLPSSPGPPRAAYPPSARTTAPACRWPRRGRAPWGRSRYLHVLTVARCHSR